MENELTALSGLSIERLRSFCEIVEAGSVAQAAGRNPVKQSQFSRQIRDLENTLNVKLFRREGRQLKLTPEGVRLAGLTNAYFAGLGDLRANVTGRLNPLRLGAAESIVRWLLAPRFPEVLVAANGALDVRTYRTAEIVDRLENGQLDAGIVRADVESDALERLPFSKLRYVLMVPRSLLLEKSSAGIRAGKPLPCVMLAGDGQFLRSVKEVAEANGLTIEVRARVESFSLAVEIAKVLDAAVFVPAQAKTEFVSERFAPVELKGAVAMDRPLVAAYSRKAAGVNERVRRFASKLSRAFEN